MAMFKSINEMIDMNLFEIYQIAYENAKIDPIYIALKQKRDDIKSSSKEIQKFYDEKEAVISTEDRKKMMEYQACQDHMDVIIAKYMYLQGMKDFHSLMSKLESLES